MSSNLSFPIIRNLIWGSILAQSFFKLSCCLKRNATPPPLPIGLCCAINLYPSSLILVLHVSWKATKWILFLCRISLIESSLPNILTHDYQFISFYWYVTSRYVTKVTCRDHRGLLIFPSHIPLVWSRPVSCPRWVGGGLASLILSWND